jgi:hypothetical protein
MFGRALEIFLCLNILPNVPHTLHVVTHADYVMYPQLHIVGSRIFFLEIFKFTFASPVYILYIVITIDEVLHVSLKTLSYMCTFIFLY